MWMKLAIGAIRHHFVKFKWMTNGGNLDMSETQNSLGVGITQLCIWELLCDVGPLYPVCNQLEWMRASTFCRMCASARGGAYNRDYFATFLPVGTPYIWHPEALMIILILHVSIVVNLSLFLHVRPFLKFRNTRFSMSFIIGISDQVLHPNVCFFLCVFRWKCALRMLHSTFYLIQCYATL
jgi:hypothetical protein